MCLGVPGKITKIMEGEALLKMGQVDFGGVKKDVSLAYVPEAQVGDYVIVHVGFAISKVDAKEAEKTLHFLKEMDEEGLV